jgi:hypothetical protein
VVVVDERKAAVPASGAVNCQEHAVDGAERPEQNTAAALESHRTNAPVVVIGLTETSTPSSHLSHLSSSHPSTSAPVVVVDERKAAVLASGAVNCQEHAVDGAKRPEQLLQVSLCDIL